MDDWLKIAIPAALGAIPGILALLNRRKATEARVSQVASETTIKQYNLLYDESRRQLDRCNAEVDKLRGELRGVETREAELEKQVRQLESLILKLGGTPP